MGKGFDIGGLFKQAQELQEKIANVQQELAERTVEASAGEMLQDLVVAAVNEGVRAARRMIEEEMGKLTGGLGIKLPGIG